VLAAARGYARALLAADVRVVRVGLIGSYARAAEGPGSDLDLLVEMTDADPAPQARYLALPPPALPVPADLVVMTSAEIAARRAESGRWSDEVYARAVWLAER
jgi:predicted nucleotidyltransferase